MNEFSSSLLSRTLGLVRRGPSIRIGDEKHVVGEEKESCQGLVVDPIILYVRLSSN